MPHPFGSRTRDEVRGIAEQCVGEIERLLRESSGDARQEAAAVAPARARHIEVPADQESFDRMCRERGWSEGLPLVAPTAERVERLLRATRRAPDELVAAVIGVWSRERRAHCDKRCDDGVRAAASASAAGGSGGNLRPAFNLQGIQATITLPQHGSS